MAGSLIKASIVTMHTLGPYEFYRAMRRDTTLDRSAECPYWTWPQWNRFFELAEEHGMTAVDQHTAGQKTVTTMHYKQIGHAMLKLWREVRNAQESGQSAYGFHIAQEQQRAEDKRKMEEMERYQAGRMKRERESYAPPQRVKREVEY